MDPSGDVTRLLLELQAGDKSALDRLTPFVYDELRRLAQSYLRRERPDHTLQATALVHEAYLKLADQSELSWQNRAQFFGIAANVMRHILVDHARLHVAEKRGGGSPKMALDEAIDFAPQRGPDVVALDDALRALAALDARKARLIELRFFGGLTAEEITELEGISTATVTREIRMAQAWLHREMGGADDSPVS